jgi:predicted CoA-binding protein
MENSHVPDAESFWNFKSFVVITDGSKPAMKWTADKLTKNNKKVFMVEPTGNDDTNTLHSLSELPETVEAAVIGVNKTKTEQHVSSCLDKGIENIWIHWRCDTTEALKKCTETKANCYTGKCPMMYLSTGMNIHTLHRELAKILGKY